MLNITPWIMEIGMTEEMILMMLFLPVLATLVNLSRYVFGLKTLGIYAPITLAYAYIFTGIRFGLLVTAAVIIASLIAYTILKKVRMHYISRITITYIFITIMVILMIGVNEVSPISITSDKHNLSTLSPLGIILIATLSDFFIKKYVKKSLTTSLRACAETVFVAIIGWGLLKTEFIQNALLEYAIIVIIALLLLNYFIGKNPGLRLREYLRFSKVAKNA